MKKPILEIEVETVGELVSLLSVVSKDMPVSDAIGDRLMVRVFERESEHIMEVG